MVSAETAVMTAEAAKMTAITTEVTATKIWADNNG